jgi:hypothetical protein
VGVHQLDAIAFQAPEMLFQVIHLETYVKEPLPSLG